MGNRNCVLNIVMGESSLTARYNELVLVEYSARLVEFVIDE